jgi:hypothetical protein
VDDQADQQSVRVGQDVPLAAFDFLARIKASRATGFRSLHRLAVDDPGGGACLPTGRFSRLHHQMMVDRQQRSVISPPVEVALDGGERRKVLGKHAPLAAGFGNVENRVHYSPKIRLTRPIMNWYNRRSPADVHGDSQCLENLVSSSDFRLLPVHFPQPGSRRRKAIPGR